MLDKPVGHTFQVDTAFAVAPSQRLHIVLLGVADVQKSARFYEALGWKRSPTSHDGFVKFDLGGYALALINRGDLAKDALEPTATAGGFARIALIHLTRTTDEVPQILAKAVAAGGTLVKPATRTHWGIAGYFKDPDGHLFEVDFEEPWVLDEQHRLVVDELK